MILDDLAKREQAIKEITREAGSIALTHFTQRRHGDFTLKGQQDFLTEADTLVENFIRHTIGKRFPEYGLLGEETGGTADTPNLWVVDPIDGTANFARGIEHFCVSMAFVYQGKTQLGATYNPATGEFYFARRGAGAYKNQQPLHVSSIDQVTSASFELGWSNRIAQSTFMKVTDALLQLGSNIRRGASGALAIAWVAEGRTDGYAELHMNAWDCLAGLLMVKEAGGYIGQFPARHDDIVAGGPVIAVTPALADHFSAATMIPLSDATKANTEITA